MTTTVPTVAANFADRPHPAHDDRYDRATEFVEVVRKIWNGWDDDAVLASVERGEWADRTKLHPPHHQGPHFSVAGLLPFPRSPQGHPVLAQAGSSDPGIALAGRFADLVFTPQATIGDGIAFRQRVQSTARSFGRPDGAVRTLPGLSFVLASTEREAKSAWAELEAASSPEFRLLNLSHLAGVDPADVAGLDADGPFPYHVFDRANGHTFAATVSRVAREGDLSFRQTAERFSTLPGGLHVTGTPEQLADVIADWFRAGASDGFTLQPLRLPIDAELFVDHVVPLLRARRIARPEHPSGTFRDRLGLPRPSS